MILLTFAPQLALSFFSTDGFPPRWYCGLGWTDALGWSHIVADFVIFLSYLTISSTLSFFILRRKDVPVTPLLWLFTCFICFCGFTHLIESIIFWWPVYRFSAFIKLITAAVSSITAGVLIRFIPYLLHLPTLAAKRALYEWTVESSPTAILCTNLEGKVIYWNQGAEKILGYKSEEIMGKSAAVIVGDLFSLEEMMHIRSLILAGELFETEGPRFRKDGSVVELLFTSSRLVDTNGNIFGIGTIAIDITKRKQLEGLVKNQLEQLQEMNSSLQDANKKLESHNQKMNTFAHVASHDLKSPLRVITNLTDLLNKGSFPAEEHSKILGMITQQSKKLGSLIDDLLRYFRADSYDMLYEEVDSFAMVEEVVSVLDKPSSFVTIIDKDLPILKAPKAALREVFHNLLSNAIKHHHYLSHGWVKITCHKTKNSYIFRVQDNGPGIPPEYHEKIFEIFETLKPKDMTGSSGVGLSIVKKILENHHGSIKVISATQGTVFEFAWPIIA